MLRGNYSAKIDDKGRLKIPNAFRALVEDQHGAGLYLTSVTGEAGRIYPMPGWPCCGWTINRAAKAFVTAWRSSGSVPQRFPDCVKAVVVWMRFY